MYVVGIVAYQDQCRPHKKTEIGFSHVGMSAHAHNIYCASSKRLKFTDGCFLAVKN